MQHIAEAIVLPNVARRNEDSLTLLGILCLGQELLSGIVSRKPIIQMLITH